MTGAEILALTRDAIVTVGAIGGAVGAIGIQKWRVAKLENEVQGLKERLEIAEITSYSAFKTHLQDMKDVYEQELEEMNEKLKTAETRNEEDQTSITSARKELMELVGATGALLQLTDQIEERDDSIAKRLGKAYIEGNLSRVYADMRNEDAHYAK